MQRCLFLAVVALTGCNLFGASPSVVSDPSDADDTSDFGLPNDQADELDSTTPGATDAATDAAMDAAMQADLGDAGASDAGADTGMDAATDAGSDMNADMAVDMPDMTPPDPCSWPDTVFCSGFEDPTLPEWSTFFTADVMYETGIIRSGAGSGRFESANADGVVVIGDLSSGIAPGDSVWLRMFLYVPNSAPTGSGGAIILGSFASEGGVLSQIIGDSAVAESYIDMTNNSFDVPFIIPRDQWVCLEAMITLSAAGKHLIAVDGTTLINESNIPINVMSPMTIVAIAGGSMASGSTVFVDDVFVGGSRPGCD